MKPESSTKQFVKFVLVGSISTVINYGFFFLLYSTLSLNYIIAAAIGYVIGLLVGFIINKSWTFQAQDKSRNFIFDYLIIYILSLALGMLFLEFLVKQLNLIAEIANILVIGLTTFTNFVGIKFLVFKKWIFWIGLNTLCFFLVF